MSIWIHRLNSIFSPRRAMMHTPAGQLTGPRQQGSTSPLPVRSGVPPITDLDLLRALGCDV